MGDDGLARDEELLGVEQIARYLDVRPTTVYRWCREGRLPCLKLGKSWRIRRSALEAFVRGGEQRRTLVEHLRTFLTVPDFVIAVAEDEDLLERLDAAFLRVGEALGGVLVKFYGADSRPLEDLRGGLRRHRLDVDRLEAEGRLRWSPEVDPVAGRAAALRTLLDEEQTGDRVVWVSFNWTKQVDLQTALRQQARIAALVDANRLVVKSTVLEAIADGWSPAEFRQAQRSHRGLIRVARDGLLLTRVVPLPDG